MLEAQERAKRVFFEHFFEHEKRISKCQSTGPPKSSSRGVLGPLNLQIATLKLQIATLKFQIATLKLQIATLGVTTQNLRS